MVNNYTFDDLIMSYISNDITDISTAKIKLKSNFGMLFFRFYFMFYITEKYVNNTTDKDIIINKFDEILIIKSNESTDNRKQIIADIIELFTTNKEYLYDTFFVKDNVYFHVYFNNLIKYVLPLPFYYQHYVQLITYRNNVTKYYKKDNVDYLASVQAIDTVKQSRMNKPKNVDVLQNEIDVHIPIKHFDPSKLNANIYIVCYGQIIAIADKIVLNNNAVNVNIILSRKNTGFTYNNLRDGVPFELLATEWQSNIMNIDIQLDKIHYLVPMRAITADDLYNVFGKISFKVDSYKYLFHSTGLEINVDKFLNMIDQPSYFHLTPFAATDKYYKSRKCLVYKIINDVIDVLDITVSIITMNPFTDNTYIYEKHKDTKLWQYIDFNNIIDYYKDKPIGKIFSENNRCIDKDSTNPRDFLNIRKYCDMDDATYYKGRRRLQEIIYGTRKYDMSYLYVFTYNIRKYERNGFKLNSSLLYKNTYHPFLQSYTYVEDYNICICNRANIVYGGAYDTYILKFIGINGFFSTDFMLSYKTGGELMLSEPKKYIQLDMYSLNHCMDKNAKFVNVINDYDNYAYATIYKNTDDAYNNLKVLGITHKLSGSEYNMVLIVPFEEYNNERIWKLSNLFIINIVNHPYNQALQYMYSMTEYPKIAYMKYNTIILKKMDTIFDNPSSHLDNELIVVVSNASKMLWTYDEIIANINETTALDIKFRTPISKMTDDSLSVTSSDLVFDNHKERYASLYNYYLNKANELVK